MKKMYLLVLLGLAIIPKLQAMNMSLEETRKRIKESEERYDKISESLNLKYLLNLTVEVDDDTLYMNPPAIKDKHAQLFRYLSGMESELEDELDDVDVYRHEALMWAIHKHVEENDAYDYEPIVTLLLKNKADVTMHDESDKNALILSCIRESMAFITMLLFHPRMNAEEIMHAYSKLSKDKDRSTSLDNARLIAFYADRDVRAHKIDELGIFPKNRNFHILIADYAAHYHHVEEHPLALNKYPIKNIRRTMTICKTSQAMTLAQEIETAFDQDEQSMIEKPSAVLSRLLKKERDREEIMRTCVIL
ncbi:MAG: hypothetical protein ACHQVS_04160 [Candidatus Babeliales bacterium]